MEDFEKMAQDLEKKAEELRSESKLATENAKGVKGICCGTCQFMSPCIPDEKTPAKCEGGCTIVSFV